MGDGVFEFQSEDFWSSKELLAEEFLSLGFYISDHPLNEYKEIFKQLKEIPRLTIAKRSLTNNGILIHVNSDKKIKILAVPTA